ncbi:PaaI family thioesterase [Desulfovibrio sp. OttesenSCG-928-G11]|nr:PaaI family thioesterase [Desulfovibrio sp. OttesenSCG-928-G11]
MTMTQSYLEAVCREGQGVNPLFAFLKARLTRVGDGEAEISMPTGLYLCQGGGMVAGGILATLADEAMAHAVMSLLAPGRSTVTAEMNIRYLRGADPGAGGELRALAKVIKEGHSLCFAEAGVLDGNERLLATAGATFFIKTARP